MTFNIKMIIKEMSIKFTDFAGKYYENYYTLKAIFKRTTTSR